MRAGIMRQACFDPTAPRGGAANRGGVVGSASLVLSTRAVQSSLPMAPLAAKLRPSRFPGMSPFMAAVVGYVVGESFTDPRIAEIKISEAENLVYIRREGAIGFDGIESLEDLRNNWNRLMDAAGLTVEERKLAVDLFRAKVERISE